MEFTYITKYYFKMFDVEYEEFVIIAFYRGAQKKSLVLLSISKNLCGVF